MTDSITTTRIPFNKPFLTGNELNYIREAFERSHLSSGGYFTEKCQQWLVELIGSAAAYLTQSGTAALEMAAVVAGIQPGDEVIMPSFTFVTTASAFALRGAVPVFVDIRPDTLNIDETLIERAISPRTKAIVPVHYAGVSCAMDRIMEIANQHNFIVIADAAHCMVTKWEEVSVGSMGHMSVFSFHETKNVISGEGGALLVNDHALVDRANVAWEKGTNRREFLLGHVDRYTWKELGSSFAPSEITAAFLWAQIEQAQTITANRLKTWTQYHDAFEFLEKRGLVRRPTVPENCSLNGHIYYLILEDVDKRNALLKFLNDRGVNAVFHFIPLHSSPGGLKYGKTSGTLPVTDDLSHRLIRVPLWAGMTESQVHQVISCVSDFFD
jgi:dTDP-4-amino-4,6-dideoxygalactose transaminase